VDLVEGIRIRGQGRALGKDIEAGKEPQGRIKSMLTHVSVALAAQEFQGKKRRK
jgi:hypothetical protein